MKTTPFMLSVGVHTLTLACGRQNQVDIGDSDPVWN